MMISVIVPCYNQARFLSEALDSIYSQTYQNWECIIINDGSEDKTPEIAGYWLKQDDRFKYAAQENKGLSGARNKGLELAEGDLIQFLDADDVIDQKKFEKSIMIIQNEPDISIVVSNFRTFTNKPEESYSPYCELSKDLLCFNSILTKWATKSIPIHCGIFRSELFKDFRFPEALKAVEDWVMWVSLFKQNPKARFIDEPLALYRRQPESLTTDSLSMDENLKKAIIHINRYIDRPEDYIYLSFVEMQRQYREIKKLERQVIRLKRQNSMRLLEKIKRAFSHKLKKRK